MTLTEFLTARIKEDEERAKRAAFGWGREWTDVTDDVEEWSTVHADGKRDMVGCEDADVTRHIASHDPARILRECETRREVMRLYQVSDSGDMPVDAWVLMRKAIATIATVYSDHPDYQDAWRP